MTVKFLSNMKKTQYNVVLRHLIKYGYVTRNWCLRRYISRLSGIIYVLKKQGYRFEISRKGGDYKYILE